MKNRTTVGEIVTKLSIFPRFNPIFIEYIDFYKLLINFQLWKMDAENFSQVFHCFSGGPQFLKFLFQITRLTDLEHL